MNENEQEIKQEEEKIEDKKTGENKASNVNIDAARGAGKTAAKKRKKKNARVRQITQGTVYIKSTYNNTLVSITDQNGNIIAWSSAGVCGFKGPKKATPYAAGVIVKNALEKVINYGLKDVNVFVKGVGMAREAAIRALNANGLNVISIKDTTPIPHNGCRPKKPRRV